MPRQCYNCGRDIADEPALEGVKGLLCFLCRYRFDEKGGEQFVLDSQKHQKELAAWEGQYAARWKAYQTIREWSDAALLLPGLSVFLLIISSAINSTNLIQSLGPAVLLICVAGLVAKLVLSALARAYSCPPPPFAPFKRSDGLNWKPNVVLDSACRWDGEPECVQFQNGYPPDWGERQRRCLERDGHRCRLCGSVERLHIHHVKPISFGGTHTLLNLITLCRRCHMRQRYYEHSSLIKYNVRAKRKYWVKGFTRSDGVTVGGHLRRVGRRGRFWRMVRRARGSAGYGQPNA
jgi:hypothetical protein